MAPFVDSHLHAHIHKHEHKHTSPYRKSKSNDRYTELVRNYLVSVNLRVPGPFVVHLHTHLHCDSHVSSDDLNGVSAVNDYIHKAHENAIHHFENKHGPNATTCTSKFTQWIREVL